MDFFLKFEVVIFFLSLGYIIYYSSLKFNKAYSKVKKVIKKNDISSVKTALNKVDLNRK